MFTIKTLNAISPVGLAKLNKNLFDVSVDADAPDGILVRSADLLNTTFNDNLLAIARAGAGVNNIPLDRCSEQGIVVFNTPGANANAVAELVIGMLIAGSRNVKLSIQMLDHLTSDVLTGLGHSEIKYNTFSRLLCCQIPYQFWQTTAHTRLCLQKKSTSDAAAPCAARWAAA